MILLNPSLWVYLGILGLAWTVYFALRRRRELTARELQGENAAAGLTEPVSLHPAIDAARCIGCGACASACPENRVLGIIADKAALISPSNCVGHGACREACPVDAISLVFGTAARGVDIPDVRPDFETNLPGVFIAGELGGMGLIRNAIEQGSQAVSSIVRKRTRASAPDLDVLIVGAGPAGVAATLGAQQAGLRYRTIEQEAVGGSTAHYPRGKIVMTRPALLPLYGEINAGETTKESLMQLWSDVEQRTGIEIHRGERMEALHPVGDDFEIETSRGKYRARSVLLCIGRRGSPRTLGVPGEALCKVVYRLEDPAQYRGRRVLVIGGGDSALEAALALCGEPGTQVTLAHRGSFLSRARPANRLRARQAAERGALRLWLQARLLRVTEHEAELEVEGRPEVLANDAVIACTGGVLPIDVLRAAGIHFETKHGTR